MLSCHKAVALLLAELLLSCCSGSELVQLLHQQSPVVVTNTYMRWLCDKYRMVKTLAVISFGEFGELQAIR